MGPHTTSHHDHGHRCHCCCCARTCHGCDCGCGSGHGGGTGGSGGTGGTGGGWTIPWFPIPTSPGQQTSNYTPWLVVRSMVGDYGGRPLPSGTVFWESPDVWVVSSAGINQPVVGEPNAVFARVSNFGLEQANGVVVKFWWADPSIAITESSAHLIGIAVVTIAGRRSAVVECPDPWIPVLENGGHECLLAEAFVPVFDPLSAPMDPTVDRHVGQRNEQLITVGAGAPFELSLHAANIAPLAQAVSMELHTVVPEAVTGLVQRLHPQRAAAMTPAAAPLSLELQIRPGTGAAVAPSDLFARGLLALGPTQAGGDLPSPVVTQPVDLDPWESRALSVSGTAPADARSGDTYVVRVVQRIGPMVAGGYSVVVMIA